MPMNPADAAMPYLNRIPGVGKSYFNPYIDAGRDAMGTLQDEFGSQIEDPNALIASLMEGFSVSPLQQQVQDDARRAMETAGAAGGTLGSTGSMIDYGRTSADISNRFMQDYLNQALGIRSQGLEGMSGINQMGYNASSNLADMLTRNLMNQGNLAYSGQAMQNQLKAMKKAALMNSIGSAVGGLASMPMSGFSGSILGAALGMGM